jgi:hypothetical protein
VALAIRGESKNDLGARLGPENVLLPVTPGGVSVRTATVDKTEAYAGSQGQRGHL